MELQPDKLEIQIAKLSTIVDLNFKRVFEEIRDLKDGTAADIRDLKRNKADTNVVNELQKKVNNDIEKRLEHLENYKGMIVVNSGLLWGGWGILLTVMIYHILK